MFRNGNPWRARKYQMELISKQYNIVPYWYEKLIPYFGIKWFAKRIKDNNI